MAAPEPKRRSVEILDGLAGFDSRGPGAGLELRRREAELDQIIHGRGQPEVSDYVALGAVRCLRNDFEGSMAAFRAARALGPYTESVYFNEAIALDGFGYPERAVDTLLEGWKRSPGSLLLLRLLIQANLKAGRFHDSLKWLQQFEVEQPGQTYDYADSIRQSVAVLERAGIEDSAVERLFAAAAQTIREAGLHTLDSHCFRQADEDSEWILREFLVPMPVDDLINLKVRFAEHLASSGIADDLDGAVIVSFSPQVT